MRRRSRSHFPRTGAIATAALIGAFVPQLASTASACDAGCPEHSAKAAQTAEQATPQAASGMRVSIDPATGQYSETPQAPSQAESALTAPSVVPHEEALQSGGFKLDTRGVRHAFVATANPGGLPKTHCVDSAPPTAEPQH